MKVVLDANILLAAFASNGACREVLEHCLLLHHLYVSDHILSELSAKLAGKFKMHEADIQANLTALRSHCAHVSPTANPLDACRDIDDLPVLGALVAAQADCLVTGDKDLLVLRQFAGRPIVSPRQFLNQSTS